MANTQTHVHTHTPCLATSLPELDTRTVMSDNKLVAITEYTIAFDQPLKYYGMYFFFFFYGQFRSSHCVFSEP